MQLNALVLSYLASAAVAAGVIVLALRRRGLAGARELALLMLAITWWLVANALEAAALDRTAKIAWSVIAYPGIQAVPILYLVFVLGWTRQDGWLTPARIALLLVVPVVSVAMAATNELHHLLWPSVTLTDAWGVTAVYEHGPWFWVEATYADVLVIAGLIALVAAIYRYPTVYAARFGLVIVGSLMPIVGAITYAAGLGSGLHADVSSIAFAVAGVIAAWAVLRLRLLDVVPVAWTTLVDSLADAVLVLDPDLRIAIVNAAATRLLGSGNQAVGRPLELVAPHVPGLIAICRAPGDTEVEIPTGSTPEGKPAVPGQDGPQPATRWLHVRVSGIHDQRGRHAGRLVTMRDVTERREMVDTIRTLSLTDELTGLLNRRGFITLAEQQMRTSMRTRDRLWLLYADLDGLKGVNDGLGHEAGDRALVEVARLLRAGSFRDADLIARLGGDEFAILATEATVTDGATLVARIEDAVDRANEQPERGFRLSVSAGVAVFDPASPRTLDQLIAEADQRMYEVKHAHRIARGGS